MPLSEDGRARLLAALREARPSDLLGSAAAVIGIILVVSGIVLAGNGVEFGATIRVLGGVLFLGGLGTVLFVESSRRAAVIGAARRIAERYAVATASWHWTDRFGLAGVAIGLVLIVPAVAVQVLFGTAFGAMVVAPGLVLFWAGAALIVYGIYRRYAARKQRQQSGAPPSRRGGRGAQR